MENVNKSGATLMVRKFDRVIWVKILGRATCAYSLDLKSLVAESWRSGYRHFVFDLGGCIAMDSTYVGSIAGMGLNFLGARQRGESASAQIANPNQQVLNSMTELGVMHLFNVITTPNPELDKFEPLGQDGDGASRAEVTRNCLEAHKILMDLKPSNFDKFKDVAQFLAEDLKKLEQPKQDGK